MQVQVIKIASIIGPDSFPFNEKGNKTFILVANDGDLIYNYYLGILKKNKPEFRYQKTTQSIVGYPNVFRSSLVGNQPVDTLKGISDGDPIVGQSYTINNSSWHTSLVEEILEECVLITKNSIYAIHNQSKLREKKIKDLGI